MRNLLPSILAVSAALSFVALNTCHAAGGGEIAFARCKPCHQIGGGAKNAVGPQLNGIDGRKAGSLEDYSYSESMKNSGVIWNNKSIGAFVKNAKSVIPNTFHGSWLGASEEQLDSLWSYISQFDSDGRIKQ